MNFTEEQLKKFREAKSAEELLALAKAERLNLSEAEIRKYFGAARKASEGELSDDELDNVAGGAIYACNDGRLVTTVGNYCDLWECSCCGGKLKSGTYFIECDGCGSTNTFCGNCRHCVYESGLWLCNHSSNRESE